MLRRLTAVSTAPVLIILFMLFLIHLQPLDTGGLVNEEVARNGRIVFAFLPYGLAVLGLGIGIRFRSCGVMIVMLSLGVAYLILGPPGDAGFDMAARRLCMLYTVPALLLPNYLLAAWTERVSWRSRRGIWALLMSISWCLFFGGRQLHLSDPSFALGAKLEFFAHQITASIRLYFESLPGLDVIGEHLPLAVDGGFFLWPTCLLLLMRAVWTRSPVLAGLGGSLAVTAPQMMRFSGSAPPGLIYTTATLIVLVSVLESVFKRAYLDALTDLPGRRSLDDTLRQLGRRYAIAMLDVDHFKRFNDRHGHDTGDQVLKMIAVQAGRIRGGQPFRYGGEEFAVVFKGKKAAARAENAMEAFRQHLAQTPFVIRKRPRPSGTRKGRRSRNRTFGPRQKVKVTVSIGLAATAGRKRNAGDVLKAADKALYKAKRSGRNRLCRET